MSQQKFIRNSVSPQVRYDISPLTAATLSYTNTLVIDENINAGTTITHAVTPGISHQFGPNLSGNMYYTFTTSNDSGTTSSSSDTTSTGAFVGHSHSITTTLGYQLDPKTSISTSAFGSIVDRTETGAQDSHTYGASIGGRRVLFSNISLFASIGPTVFKLQGEKQKLRANWQLSLDSPIPLTPRLTLTLTTQQSILNTVTEVNNEGLVLRQLAAARLTYTPTAFFSGSLFVEYTRTEFLENTGTVGAGTMAPETLSSIGVTTSYALTKSLSLTGIYRYQRRDSDQPSENFEENRVTLAVTGTFPIF